MQLRLRRFGLPGDGARADAAAAVGADAAAHAAAAGRARADAATAVVSNSSAHAAAAGRARADSAADRRHFYRDGRELLEEQALRGRRVLQGRWHRGRVLRLLLSGGPRSGQHGVQPL